MDKPTIALVPWQQRIVEERDQLRERSEKLEIFIYSGKARALGEPHTSLLYQQYAVMQLYREVLDRRIALFVEVDPFNRPPEDPQTPAA